MNIELYGRNFPVATYTRWATHVETDLFWSTMYFSPTPSFKEVHRAHHD